MQHVLYIHFKIQLIFLINSQILITDIERQIEIQKYRMAEVPVKMAAVPEGKSTSSEGPVEELGELEEVLPEIPDG